MAVHYLNYSNRRFVVQRIIANFSAQFFASFDSIISCDPSSIDPAFSSQYSHILSVSRGAGLWLWKPYIILKTLNSISYGDYLFYSDSGVFFYSSIQPIISTLVSLNQDIGCFELPLIERQWTKPDLLESFPNESQKPLGDTNQIMSSFHLIKKSSFSLSFYSKFLELCCDICNIDDSHTGNFYSSEFLDHRHDQSVLSLLYKTSDLIPLKDPTQFGLYPFAYGSSSIKYFEYDRTYYLPSFNSSSVNYDRTDCPILLLRVNSSYCDYGYLIHHSRSTNQFFALLRFWFLRLLSSLGVYKGICS